MEVLFEGETGNLSSAAQAKHACPEHFSELILSARLVPRAPSRVRRLMWVSLNSRMLWHDSASLWMG